MIEQPVKTALDRRASRGQRVSAIQVVPQENALELLPLVFSSGHPLSVRSQAVDRMVGADADRFWQRVSTGITRVNDWPMLQLLCERAALENRRELIPALVLNWARPSQRFADSDRPEHEAIASLSQGISVEDSLWQLIRSEGAELHDRYRVAGWTVLSRLLPPDELRAGIQEAQAGPGFIAELKVVACSLDRLPCDREGVLRMRTLLANVPATRWDQWADQRGGQLESPGARNLSLRHLPAVSAAAGETTVLHADLESRLRTARHVSRGHGAVREVVAATPDRLADHAESLGWADRLVLFQIIEALDHADVRRAIFQQADADKADETSEYGGVLAWDDQGRVAAILFPPGRRQHDQVFHASDACVEAMHLGLAHYHFHAQQYNNAVWAGPGGGDFAFADALQANCVVFTFIDRDTINVDAYFPGKIVIDLGCITRPLD